MPSGPGPDRSSTVRYSRRSLPTRHRHAAAALRCETAKGNGDWKNDARNRQARPVTHPSDPREGGSLSGFALFDLILFVLSNAVDMFLDVVAGVAAEPIFHQESVFAAVFV